MSHAMSSQPGNSFESVLSSIHAQHQAPAAPPCASELRHRSRMASLEEAFLRLTRSPLQQ